MALQERQRGEEHARRAEATLHRAVAQILTDCPDISAERYWTVVSEIEVDSLEKHTEMTRKSSEMKEFQEAMKGYHDLVDHGRREIYVLEN